MVEDAELPRGLLGVAAIAVGEDELAARQLADRRAEHRIGLQPGIVDVVHLLEEIVGVDAVPVHQPVQRRAVFEVEFLLQLARLLARQLQQLRHIGRHLHVDLREQVRMVRIERVVEIEDPVGDMGETSGVGLGCHARLCTSACPGARCRWTMREWRNHASAKSLAIGERGLSTLPVNVPAGLGTARAQHFSEIDARRVRRDRWRRC